LFSSAPKACFCKRIENKKKAKDAKQLSFLSSLKRSPQQGSRELASNPETLKFISLLKTKKAKDAKQLSFLYSLKRSPQQGSRELASNPETMKFISLLKTKKKPKMRSSLAFCILLTVSPNRDNERKRVIPS
jgi:hypothetical protein